MLILVKPTRLSIRSSGVRRKKFRGVQGYCRPRGGPGGGGAPRTRDNFRNLQRIPYENCPKCNIFAYFAKTFQNPALNFRAFEREAQLVEEIFTKFWNFLMKVQYKNCIFIYFWENLLLQIELSEITSIFFYNFFRFGGGGLNPPTPTPSPPRVRHWSEACYGLTPGRNEIQRISSIYNA